MSPSLIPKFDNPKTHMTPALQLFERSREKRLSATPPNTTVRSLSFEYHPFEVQRWDEACALCAATDSFLNEVIVDNTGARLIACSDSDHCRERRVAGGGTSADQIAVQCSSHAQKGFTCNRIAIPGIEVIGDYLLEQHLPLTA